MNVPPASGKDFNEVTHVASSLQHSMLSERSFHVSVHKALLYEDCKNQEKIYGNMRVMISGGLTPAIDGHFQKGIKFRR